MTQVFNSVWDALENTPQEAENMRLRSELIIAITQQLAQTDGTQTQKAKQLDITQPRLNDLLQGRINKFSLDALVTIAAHAGLSVSLTAQPPRNAPSLRGGTTKQSPNNSAKGVSAPTAHCKVVGDCHVAIAPRSDG